MKITEGLEVSGLVLFAVTFEVERLSGELARNRKLVDFPRRCRVLRSDFLAWTARTFTENLVLSISGREGKEISKMFLAISLTLLLVSSGLIQFLTSIRSYMLPL